MVSDISGIDTRHDSARLFAGQRLEATPSEYQFSQFFCDTIILRRGTDSPRISSRVLCHILRFRTRDEPHDRRSAYVWLHKQNMLQVGAI